MEQSIIINKTINFVKVVLTDAEGGHDWWHREIYNPVIKPNLNMTKEEYKKIMHLR